VGSTRSKREFARASTTIALALDRPRSRRSRSSTRSSFTSQIASLRAPDAVARAPRARNCAARAVASRRVASDVLRHSFRPRLGRRSAFEDGDAGFSARLEGRG
jgi:hypothetical protein